MYIFPLFWNNYDGRLHVFYKCEETNHFQDVEIDKILSIDINTILSYFSTYSFNMPKQRFETLIKEYNLRKLPEPLSNLWEYKGNLYLDIINDIMYIIDTTIHQEKVSISKFEIANYQYTFLNKFIVFKESIGDLLPDDTTDLILKYGKQNLV